ncbi:hypothetical protein GX411_02485 [Candidatus Fermentibacteria bacterium]|nr:hypothetical protein [Candidatus Fermentibacteria bacterium]
MRLHTLLIFPALLAVPGCGSREGPRIPPGTKARLEEWAGILAPVVALPPGMAPEAPDSAALAELLALCESSPGGYSYFYRCLADSVNTLEPPPATCREATDTLLAPGPIPVESLTVAPGGGPGSDPSTR